jgi:pterin-4a-carbinolamine dehydratase
MAEISIFISYRRNDDAARAAMLDRIIAGTFNEPAKSPKVRIYRDTSERLGIAWPEEISERCGSADLVLVVIGPKWLEAKGKYGRRRIDEPDDWVRQEIELACDRTVIPIAFGGVSVPPAEALPDAISYLASRRGVSVRDEFAEMDLQPVLAEIERHLPSAETRSSVSGAAGDPGKLPYPNPPLVVKPAPMTEEDINIAIRELLHDWEVVGGPLPENPDERRVELHRTFRFRNFLDVMAFMVEIGDFADKANHHPRWENIYNTLKVYLTTWDIGHRISPLDIQLAQYFNRTYKRYQESSPAGDS